MKKQVFQMIRANKVREPVEYYPIVYLAGSDAWRLALHREPVLSGKGDWIVSDPVSGYRVCRITASYKSMPVASRDLTVTQARAAALLDLDATVTRIGLARFTRVLAEAQTKKDPENVIQP